MFPDCKAFARSIQAHLSKPSYPGCLKQPAATHAQRTPPMTHNVGLGFLQISGTKTFHASDTYDTDLDISGNPVSLATSVRFLGAGIRAGPVRLDTAMCCGRPTNVRVWQHRRIAQS